MVNFLRESSSSLSEDDEIEDRTGEGHVDDFGALSVSVFPRENITKKCV